MTAPWRSPVFALAAWTFSAHKTHPPPFADSFSARLAWPGETTGRRWMRSDIARAARRSPLVTPTAPSGLGSTAHSKAVGIDSAEDENVAAASTRAEEPKSEGETLDMPWGDAQESALRESLPKVTVILPSPTSGGGTRRYAMWRTLAREVPELAGYPISFLLRMHELSTERSGDAAGQETPRVLPMVDDFHFTPNGGIDGRVYGLLGVADGTRVRTPPLVSAEATVPLGYVTTRADSDSAGRGAVAFSYELGTCASSGSAYSLDGTERGAALEAARRLVMEGMADPLKPAASVAKDAAVAGSGLLTDAEANRDLAYVGGATAMLLASAAALDMLSHHLTVNVFWV